MRNIVAITQVSIDGVMQGPGGAEEDPSNGFTQGGWAMPFVDDALSQVIDETIAVEFDMLLGRRTYDIFAGYWPHQDNAIGRAFGKATKYVVTHRSKGLDWKRSERIGGDVMEKIRHLKASTGPELHVWGSNLLLQALIAADLVDEYRMWVSPVVLGQGKRLFGGGVPPRSLTLVATQKTPSGVLVNTYRPAGLVPQA
ncbi:MAG: dihydrofolate reductase family protein [Halobacteriales archaeon]|nr:dihydrofolate reductase family protein [Halobacteriales archaeon]